MTPLPLTFIYSFFVTPYFFGDLLDISPTLAEPAGGRWHYTIDEFFLRSFKSNPPEPWNWNNGDTHTLSFVHPQKAIRAQPVTLNCSVFEAPKWNGLLQSTILESLGCIWFNRTESKDREIVARKG
ncbi:Peroxidase [Forsythia ovata]|uniref:Peroxidase n=1 Tax=Forsythia ovata TaxID=205694 RepID=A0ABD1QPK4_9LAMI